ncbi:MAG: acetylxylan esterase [Anaerolineae bacterium]
MEKADILTDESQVPDYALPDPLAFEDGAPVGNAETWLSQRRPEVLSLFEYHVYGRAHARPETTFFETTAVADDALNGKAIRKEVTVRFSEKADSPRLNLLLYLPSEAHQPVPLFLGLNFHGNHTIHSDPGITVATGWARNNPALGVENHQAAEAKRGAASGRWPVERILQRGYGLATIYCGDIDPDYHDSFENGVHALFPRDDSAGDAWGTIAAWAWGLSRGMDYLETDGDVDERQVAVIGHSRLGKTALWAGATDPRFALVISNNSGCGGAALSRRRFGETVKAINNTFPHWFCTNFEQYNDNERALPVDQHELIALIAPRPVYVASAEGDLWADPRGEFLGAKGADPVYRLLGTDGLPASSMPPVHEPSVGTIGYHIRAGGHGITDYDWEQYLNFADRHLQGH